MKIAIFAREPIPGRTKTRLARTIGDEAACALHRAFVLDTLARCRAHPALEPELHGADPGAFLASLGVPLIEQAPGDLGARMAHALAQGADLIVGTDAPTLPRAIFDRAIDGLARHDVILGPAADGGYVLIGSRADPAFLRGSIRWSSQHTLADTIRAARAHDLRVGLTPPHHDVDDVDDLRLLRAHLAHDPRAAPATSSAIAALWPKAP